MASGTLLVTERRKAQSIAPLGIRCDVKEIPEDADGSKPVGWWLAEVASFEGLAATGMIQADQLNNSEPVTVHGTLAIAVNPKGVKAILSPNDDSSPAVWLTWRLSDVSMGTAGSQGFLKKRPVDLTLTNGDAVLRLKAVSRLHRSSGRFQTGQEASLVRALGNVQTAGGAQ